MSGFAGEWLALRERADHAARDSNLAARAAALLAGRDSVRVMDLGAGTGSNLRALAPVLPPRQTWLMVDDDEALLARLRAPEGVAIEPLRRDLAAGPGALAGLDLVTTAAFLDLVSRAWAERLADALAEVRVPFYAVLSYDGSAAFAPEHPLDAAMREAVNAHQGSDKGFGPALGPRASTVLAGLLEARGFTVSTGDSPWRLGPRDGALQAAFVDGWAEAARESGALPADALEEWHAFRRAHADRGRAVVGHDDLLAVPPAA